MITKKEYKDALETVSIYERQIRRYKTKILDWDRFYDCPVRVYNILKSMTIEPHYKFRNIKVEYIEDITKQIFMSYRNAGRKSWIDFKSVRGY